MKKPLIAGALAVALATTSGCGTLMRYVGEFTAMLITQKTASLNSLAVRVNYTTNLLPRDSGLIEAEGGGDAWQDGANLLTVVLVKRQGVGMYELDGKVGYQENGKGPVIPMAYFGKGAYVAPLARNNHAPKTIVLTAGGQTARFHLAPAKAVTIKAVNGKAPKQAVIDLGKDLVLDLAYAPGAGSQVKVALAGTALGIKTMMDVGVFKATNRLVVPKEAFRNLLVSSSQDLGLVGLEKGANYLLVERYHADYAQKANVGAAEVIGKAWAWTPVTVKGEAPMNIKLEASGSVGPVAYRAYKPNAFYGPPLKSQHQIALGSLHAIGKLYHQESKTSEHEGLGVRTITTTTTFLKFPDLPDSHWETLLGNLERELGAAVMRATGAELLPIERVANGPTYKALEEMAPARQTRTAPDGEQVVTDVVKTLRGSRHVFPASFATMLGSVSSTFPADRPISRMISESKVDALMTGTLVLHIGANDKGNIVLLPTLAYSLYGPPNGYAAGPTSYGEGSVTIGQGVPFNGDAVRANPAELSRIVQVDALAAGVEKALRDLRAKEQAAGYDKIWSNR